MLATDHSERGAWMDAGSDLSDSISVNEFIYELLEFGNMHPFAPLPRLPKIWIVKPRANVITVGIEEGLFYGLIFVLEIK